MSVLVDVLVDIGAGALLIVGVMMFLGVLVLLTFVAMTGAGVGGVDSGGAAPPPPEDE